jgi:hypothetical protein
MKPSRHIKTSAVLSVAVAPWLGWHALLVLAGGTLLDLDRYLWHAVRYRTFRVREAVARFQGRDRLRGDPRLLHSVEFLAVLAVACIARPALWPLGLGVAFHLALDVMVHKSRGRFWCYPDFSHVRFLVLDLIRKRIRPARRNSRHSGQDA